MAFTTNYSLLLINSNALGTARGNIDVVGLDSGGFAGFGDRDGTLATSFFDATGTQAGNTIALTGTNGALDLLSNGTLVIASELNGAVLYRITDQAGAIVVPARSQNDADTYNPDVTAVGSGFWIVTEDEKADGIGGDADIEIRRYDAAGSIQELIIVNGSGSRDTGAAIAELDGGNVAVAWTRTIGAQTEIWTAMYDANGNVVTGAKLVDTDGATNRGVSITAMAGGGYALVYEDSAWGADTDVTLAVLDSAGNTLDVYNVNDPNGAGDTSLNANASVTRLTNGVLAISYDYFDGATPHAAVSLFDPVTGAIVFGGNITGPRPIGNDVSHSVVTSFGTHRFVAGAVDETAEDVVGNAWQLTRTWLGDGANDVMNGDDLIDIMNGGDGDDTLNGGVGPDQMIGGGGSDTYYVDDATDAVTEGVGPGTDYVLASVGYTLGDNVEKLKLLGTAAINGVGNALNNIMAGNGAANVLNGMGGDDVLRGGEGGDTLIGGTGGDDMAGSRGNDVYYVDSINDVLLEKLNSGSDVVFSSISFTLGANFEKLTLTGTGAINGGGNALNNAILGNAGANVLNGFAGADALRGGAGNDTLDGGTGADNMAGGKGNDIYYVDNAADVVTEGLNSGGDVVFASVTYALTNNVEKLTLTGSGAIDGTGNGLNNIIAGNAGQNTLSGLAGDDTIRGGLGADTLNGGAGHDKLSGGGGADAFVFNAPLNAANSDTITDMTAGVDRIHLASSVFTALGGPGTLAAGLFVTGTGAVDGSDRIIYNAATGALLYDADGVGGIAALQIATLATGLTLTNTDFLVI